MTGPLDLGYGAKLKGRAATSPTMVPVPASVSPAWKR